VIFHARMAEEQGAFDFDDVAAAISDKMERRHPHIFGDRADGGHHLWEEVKAEERAAKGHNSALEGVALGLPALTRAEKIQKRAARVGFDWPDISGPRAKIHEELAEPRPPRRRRIAPPRSATSCSPSPITPVTIRSTPRPRSAPPPPASNSASASSRPLPARR
jgi:uncharacterized protein YabN with tetrapyrrole methylase and pyrophosphatase domain